MTNGMLYSSPNGDKWLLVQEPSGSAVIRHEANLASGGKETLIGLSEFLNAGRGPEQQELLRLIATLVEECAEPAATT